MRTASKIQWCAAVTAAPRDERYLLRTVVSLLKAGWPTTLVQTDCGQGAWVNFRNALQAALRLPWNWLLTCQDDVEIAAGLRGKLERDIPNIPDVGLLSPYCPQVHRGGPGWWRMDADDLPRKAYGACLYAWPRTSVIRLLANPPSPQTAHRVDFWCGQFCRDNNLGYYYHTPSLAQHAGDVSAIFKDGNPNVEYRYAAHDWLKKV